MIRVSELGVSPSPPPPPVVSEFSAPGVFSSESIQSAFESDGLAIFETPLEASPVVTVCTTPPPVSFR
ncbi:MAG TPA: hypothetical protein QF529_06415, partial [Candidatus Thalassarchaeaceae archaeon]|nr:hypothetical protein [Candidatus Thalassarchaeaceae archaeon]